MPRGKPHSDEIRAQVIAALLAGQGVDEVAAQYHLPKATVSRWRKGLGAQMEQVGTKKAEAFDELIGTYLREVLETLSVQARFFRTTTWLERQSATEAAVLHGVLTDKAIRILEAAEPPDSDAVDAVPD